MSPFSGGWQQETFSSNKEGHDSWPGTAFLKNKIKKWETSVGLWGSEPRAELGRCLSLSGAAGALGFARRRRAEVCAWTYLEFSR